MEILKQPQYSPVAVEKQVAIIYAGVKGLMVDMPVDKVKEFEEFFLSTLEQKHADVLDHFKAGKYDEADLKKVEALAKDLVKQYK